MSGDQPEQGGARGFLKNVLGGARKITEAAVSIDQTPGVRWLRKHAKAHHGDPSKASVCSCKGCLCATLVIYGLRCHPCIRGRHSKTRMGRGLRRLRATGPVTRAKPKHDARWRSPAVRRKAATHGREREPRAAAG